MNGGRRGSSRAIPRLGAIGIACVVVAAVACGQAFTTSPATGEDAGVTPNEAGIGWCAAQDAGHTFCEDFTRGVPGMLSTTVTTGGAAFSANTMDFTSPPQSLLATTPALIGTGANGMATAIASKAFSDDVGTRFSLSLDVELDSSLCFSKGDKDGVSILALDFPDAVDANYEILIQVLPAEIDAYELTGQMVTAQHQFPTSPPAKWQRWTLDVNGTAAGSAKKTIDLSFGSTTAFSEPLQKAPIAALQHPTLVVGAIVKNVMGQSPGCQVGFDDILFDVRTVAATL